MQARAVRSNVSKTRKGVKRPRVGCSGWNYKAWSGPFYPRRLPTGSWLEFYSEEFDTVEVNNTFYRLPERSTFASWRDRVPGDFLIAVKASRFLTHMKRLKDPAEPIARLFSRAAALGPRLGPVLYQLPQTLRIDLPRLENFLNALPRRIDRRPVRHVLEFRHPSWYVAETWKLLEKERVALCLHDKAGSEISGPPVGPFIYVRFHGTSGRYHGSYGQRDLDVWARRLAEHTRDGMEVFAYFNNDPGAAAVANARSLRRALLRRL